MMQWGSNMLILLLIGGEAQWEVSCTTDTTVNVLLRAMSEVNATGNISGYH